MMYVHLYTNGTAVAKDGMNQRCMEGTWIEIIPKVLKIDEPTNWFITHNSEKILLRSSDEIRELFSRLVSCKKMLIAYDRLNDVIQLLQAKVEDGIHRRME